MDDYKIVWHNYNAYNLDGTQIINSTDYMSKREALSLYNKMKKDLDNKAEWCEVRYEPLDKEDFTEIVKSFETQYCEILGKAVAMRRKDA